MENNSIRTKLQNIICSEQFCGLCFADTKEMSTDMVLEVASENLSHQIRLGDIYSSVFKENIEDLASKLICSNCTDHLIQSYTFIRNTKFTSQLLKKYLNNLQTEILRLNYNKKNELEYDNICIILDDENINTNKDNKATINDDSKELQCTVCQEKFGALQDFLNHYKAHSKTHKKDMGIEKFKIKNSQTERTFKLTEPKSLNTQKPKILEVPDKNKMMHKIDNEIPKKSKTNKKFYLQSDNRIGSLKEIKQELSCGKCQRCFDNVTLLQNHLKSHLKVVKCHECNEDINPSKLEEHLKIHSKRDLKCIKKVKPNITCELCGYITWNSILLECHMNRYHLKIKPYVCHICSKNFIGKHLLKKHIKTHTDDQSIICNFCSKKLANLSCLKNHLKLHTGEKNYKCQICGEKFRSASIRSVHRVKKHSVKEASCPLCLSKFYTLVELRRHIIKIHWKKKTQFDPRKLEGMENHYHLFHDGRRIRMGDDDIDFYMPC